MYGRTTLSARMRAPCDFVGGDAHIAPPLSLAHSDSFLRQPKRKPSQIMRLRLVTVDEEKVAQEANDKCRAYLAKA